MSIEEQVIQCAAEAYEKDAAGITPDTNIREELSNQSLVMIAFISTIEDALGVSIELRDAAGLNTVGDFIAKVTALLG